MKRIGVIANIEKDIDLIYTKILLDSINSGGATAIISSEIAKELKVKQPSVKEENINSEDDVYKHSQIVISLGGDGTFLKVARHVFNKGIPLLGINLGNLGFLTEIDKKDIKTAVDHIIKDEFDIENRMMLEATILRDGVVISEDTALNDIVISRGALSRILHLKTYMNNAFADTFPGDGLIISSPTGSTGYSLSAGGPIVEPSIDLIIVTPICPHILYSRSFITSGNGDIKVEVDEEYCHTATVTVDGQKDYEVRGGDCVDVKKSDYSVKIVKINPRNFFKVLRTKIYERGENLIKDEI